jgi:hypothetical protein
MGDFALAREWRESNCCSIKGTKKLLRRGHYSSRFNFRFPQCVSLRSGLNTRSQPRLSIVVSGWRESQFFRRQRPVNRPLGFCHGLGFGGSSPPYGNACVERDRPFPHVPSNALNDAIRDAAIFHALNTRSICAPFAFGLGAGRPKSGPFRATICARNLPCPESR